MVCRAVVAAKTTDAKDALMYNFTDELKNSGLFSTNTLGAVAEDPSTPGFSFHVTLKVAHPIKF
jgi:hypothetical protein